MFLLTISEYDASASGNHRQNGTEMVEMQALAKIPVKTFPIKKRINTELFIDGEVKLYIQKYRRYRIKVIRSGNIGPLRRG